MCDAAARNMRLLSKRPALSRRAQFQPWIFSYTTVRVEVKKTDVKS
jgi:hypothetical protein